MDKPPLRLQCTRCDAATDFDRAGEVVRCAECGKRHHVDSLFVPVGGEANG